LFSRQFSNPVLKSSLMSLILSTSEVIRLLKLVVIQKDFESVCSNSAIFVWVLGFYFSDWCISNALGVLIFCHANTKTYQKTSSYQNHQYWFRRWYCSFVNNPKKAQPLLTKVEHAVEIIGLYINEKKTQWISYSPEWLESKAGLASKAWLETQKNWRFPISLLMDHYIWKGYGYQNWNDRTIK